MVRICSFLLCNLFAQIVLAGTSFFTIKQFADYTGALNDQLSKKSPGKFEKHYDENGNILYLATDSIELSCLIKVKAANLLETKYERIINDQTDVLSAGYYRYKIKKLNRNEAASFQPEQGFHLLLLDQSGKNDHCLVKLAVEPNDDISTIGTAPPARECPKKGGKMARARVKQMQEQRRTGISPAVQSAIAGQQSANGSDSGGNGPPRRPNNGGGRKEPQAALNIDPHSRAVVKISLERLCRASKRVRKLDDMLHPRFRHKPHIDIVQDALNDPDRKEWVLNYADFDSIRDLFNCEGEGRLMDQQRRYDMPSDDSNSD